MQLLNEFIYFSPVQTTFIGFWRPQSVTNPVKHSHLYDPMVLLQTEVAPQASGDWHSSISAEIQSQPVNTDTEGATESVSIY